MSRATRWTLAWPCLPVFEVDISTILHGRFWGTGIKVRTGAEHSSYRSSLAWHKVIGSRTLIMTKPPFLRAEHCMGKVSEAPESPWLKSVSSSCSAILETGRGLQKMANLGSRETLKQHEKIHGAACEEVTPGV